MSPEKQQANRMSKKFKVGEPLKSEAGSSFQDQTQIGGLLRMIKIRTKQKCKKCNTDFKNTGKLLVCPECFEEPTRFFLDILAPDGKRKKQKKLYGFKTYTEAARAAVNIEVLIEKGEFKPERVFPVSKANKKYTFEQLYQAWLDKKKKKLKPSYTEKLEQYKKDYECFMWVDVRTIGSLDISNFEDEIAEARISESTQKKKMDALKAFFRYLYDKDVIEKLPKFPSYDVEEKEGEWIDKDVQLKGLAEVEDMYRPAIEFMFVTGLRTAEIRAIKWDCVRKDVPIPHIVIKRGFSNDVLYETTKEKNIGFIPITPTVESILKRSMRRLDCDHVFYNIDRITEKAIPFSKHVLRNAWRRACRKAKIKYIGLHNAGRHSFVTQKILEGKDIEKVGRAVMHKSLKSTKRYSHIKTLQATREVYE